MKKFTIYHWRTDAQASSVMTLKTISHCGHDTNVVISKKQKRYYIPPELYPIKPKLVRWLQNNIGLLTRTIIEGHDRKFNI